MFHLMLALAFVQVPAAPNSAPTVRSVATTANTIAHVRITQSVKANGTTLQPGSYELRLTDEYVKPHPGQSPDAERWVEIVSNGRVVAREAAVVLRDEGAEVGTSSASGAGRARVELLRGGDFLRVSVNRGGERYLLHFPVTP